MIAHARFGGRDRTRLTGRLVSNFPRRALSRTITGRRRPGRPGQNSGRFRNLHIPPVDNCLSTILAAMRRCIEIVRCMFCALLIGVNHN
jgi:hypothetical protein